MALKISLLNEHKINALDIGIETDCESDDEEDDNESIPSDYNSEELEVFKKEKSREINDKLDRF